MKIIEMVMTRGYLLKEDDHYGINEFKGEDVVATTMERMKTNGSL
jgi:hypothetical protein